MMNLQCDAHLGLPCGNCQRGISLSTGQAPICEIKGSRLPAELSALAKPTPARSTPERQHSSHWDPSHGRNLRGRTADRVRVSDAHLQQTQRLDEQRCVRLAAMDLPAAQLARLNATARPARSTTSALRRASPSLVPSRSGEAELRRRQSRADSRRIQEMQDEIVDLNARLKLAQRAKSAAEERAQLAYDQGYQYGVQTTGAQAYMHEPGSPFSGIPHSAWSQMLPAPLGSQGHGLPRFFSAIPAGHHKGIGAHRRESTYGPSLLTVAYQLRLRPCRTQQSPKATPATATATVLPRPLLLPRHRHPRRANRPQIRASGRCVREPWHPLRPSVIVKPRTIG